jgi:hypothetical protein
MNVHISWARKDAEHRGIRFCPTERRRRRVYGWYQDWYGWMDTCLGCGEQWGDGEQLERPFRPRWRADNIAEARVGWNGMSAPFVDHHPEGWLEALRDA